MIESSMKILFLVPYPLREAPSQRFRFEQYFKYLNDAGIRYYCQSFLTKKTWHILYKPKHHIHKVAGISWGFIKRLGTLFTIYQYDFVFIHREATPIGPPVIEWIISKLMRKKIIFDFDDAIWLPNTTKENKLVALLKFHSKTRYICKWAYKVSVGNQFLFDFAKTYNQNVVYNPTTIDTVHQHVVDKSNQLDKITIGWTGTHSTLFYLNDIVNVIQRLEQKYDFYFMVIADKNPHLPLKSFVFSHWTKEDEILVLNKINIGIMPLKNDQWSMGKCGFKALQYMALGIPTLASDVGVNNIIIEHTKNGFICRTSEDWYNYLELLINDAGLRLKIGQSGRLTVEQRYSVISNYINFLGLFNL
jgi:glycosyltransferase involved in cell wall biosynthesis